MLKKIIILTISVKICILLLIIVAFNTFTFSKINYELNFHYPEKAPITLQTAFKTWDSQYYLYLSEFWYKPNHISNAFHPLFPLLIRLLTPLFHNSLAAGLLLSNILSLLGMIYFYLFLKEYFKNRQELAFASVALLLVFPSSFYFSLIYAESLAFLLTTIFFYYLYKNRFGLASIAAFMLPLSRPIGIFIILPFSFYLLSQLLFITSKLSRGERIKKIVFDKRLFLLLTPLLGFLLYLFIMYQSTSSITDGFDAHMYYDSKPRIENIVHPDIFLSNLFAHVPEFHVSINSGLDRTFFIIFIFSLYFIYKLLDKTLFVYVLTIAILPLFGSFMSYTRFLLLAFPIVMISAILFKSKGHTLYKILILLFLIILQIIFIIRHTLNYWVA